MTAQRPGIEVLASDRADLVRGSRVGLIAHPASVGRDLAHATDLLRNAGAHLVRLFAPEHGVGGGAQDMVAVDEVRDPVSGLPVVSLYGETEDSLVPRAAHLADIDVLVADLQDVGSRYYTFFATVVRALPAAASAGVRVVVADRPNPLGRAVEGNVVAEGFRSFVGELPVPNRHGMTVGELCLMARATRSIGVELEVVPAEGWRGGDAYDEPGLPWVMPSPNMPTVDTALVYPGGCLVEGTNLSEGRGTTRPFELLGAPWLDGRALAARLNALGLPGAAFRPARFLPGFQKHAGTECGGIQIHVTDRRAFRPVLTGLAVVIAAREEGGDDFRWRTERYEFVDEIPAFDLLAGTDAWRLAIENGASAREIAAAWDEERTGSGDPLAEHALYERPHS